MKKKRRQPKPHRPLPLGIQPSLLSAEQKAVKSQEAIKALQATFVLLQNQMLTLSTTSLLTQLHAVKVNIDEMHEICRRLFSMHRLDYKKQVRGPGPDPTSNRSKQLLRNKQAAARMRLIKSHSHRSIWLKAQGETRKPGSYRG